MELTPQTLHAVEFREARRGGYNTRDVDDFLERVAQGVGSLQERIRELAARIEGAEHRAAEAQRQLEDARHRPANDITETDDTLRRTLVLAQRTADATIKEAKDEASRLLTEAREESTRVRAEIEAEARRGTEGARAAAEAEIEQLLETRDSLKRDIDVLGDKMREQRDRLRAGISELQRALDDPATLEPVGPIPLTQVESPGQTGRHTRIDIPGMPMPGGLPMRKSSSEREPAPAPSNGQPHAQPHEPAVPFLPGAQVASLQEAPQLPRRPVEPPVTASPFSSFPSPANGAGSAADNATSPWPSQLRTSVEEARLNGTREQGHNGANGHEARPGDDEIIEPGSRPSEWGRPVFDRHDEGEPSRFGR
jgi:DivIVA domain-containing protein